MAITVEQSFCKRRARSNSPCSARSHRMVGGTEYGNRKGGGYKMVRCDFTILIYIYIYIYMYIVLIDRPYKEVLSKLGAPTLSAMLLQQQLHYFRKLARRPHSCKIRSMVFKEDLSMQVLEAPGRRGTPKLQWANEIFKVVSRMFESHAIFSACVSNAMKWRSRIRAFCRAAAPT